MDVKSIHSQAAEAYRPRTERMTEAAEQEAKTQRKKPAAGEGDSLRLSPEAVLLSTARSAAMQGEDMRAERVEALRARIADGSYTIDTRKIAARLLSEETDLFR